MDAGCRGSCPHPAGFGADSLGPDGRFNNELISSLVNNFTVQEQLLNQLIETMETLGYGGLDIDFGVYKGRKTAMPLRNLSPVPSIPSPLGYPVSSSSSQRLPQTSRVFYIRKRLSGARAIADHVLLMTYEWGYTYGPPMAVAPLSMVRRVVDYAVTEIAPRKNRSWDSKLRI